MWILIPSYQPSERLVELVSRLRGHAHILVVDDGSGPAYAEYFDAADRLGAVVIAHEVNRGKAAALRTGFSWLMEHAKGKQVVCADSDGQHLPADIRAVGAELERRRVSGAPDAVVLGARSFSGEVPLRSRAGNAAMTALFATATGLRVSDTQTGLRGYPPGLLPWARGVRGERFAYELWLLLDGSRNHVPVVEVPIETVYLENNASSHFRPVRDSARVFVPLLLFAASSLVAFGIDTVALMILSAATGSLALSLIAARVLSATVNFWLNRKAVFRSEGRLGPQLWRYAALAVLLLIAGYVGIATLTAVGVPLVVAKVATDMALWVSSYGAQRAFVFAHRDASGAQRHEKRLHSVGGVTDA